MKQEVDSLPEVDNAKSCTNKSNGTMKINNLPKRRRISREVDGSHSPSANSGVQDSGQSLSIEMINTQIFMDGNKSSVKLTVFAELYSCSDCGEVFYTQFGLESHHSRVCLKITLSCPHCQVQRSFANRCQLLNHFKSHGVTPSIESMKDCIAFEPPENHGQSYDYQINIPQRPATQTTATPPPPDSASSHFQKSDEPDHCASPEAPNGNANCTTHLIVNPLLSNIRACPSLSAVEPKPKAESSIQANARDGSGELSYFCSGCQKDYLNLQKFVAHIRTAEASLASTDLFQCVIDKVPSRSLCGLRLHTAMFHKKVHPFVCPDCGQSFLDWDIGNNHARNTCAHFAKTVVYTCKKKAGNHHTDKGVEETSHGCNSLYESIPTMLAHLQDQHTRVVLQCAGCPNAFTTRNLLLRHLFVEHQISSDEESSESTSLVEQMTKQLTQCLICEVVFCTTEAFRNHFLNKLTDHSPRIMAFRCHTCLGVFEHREAYRSHQCTQGSDVLLDIPISTKSEPTFFPIVESYFSKKSTSRNNGKIRDYGRQKCAHCASSVLSKNLVKHEYFCTQNPRLKLFCKVCSKSFGGSFGFLNHGRDHLSAGLHICLFCNNQELRVDEELDNHIRLNHINQILTFPHNCLLCETSLADKASTEIHFKDHHQIGVENRFKCAICGLLFSQLCDLTKHKSIDHVDQKPIIVSSIKTETESPSTRNWNYQCKFCKDKDFITIQGLKKHVRHHHTDADYKKIRWSEMKRANDVTTVPIGQPDSAGSGVPSQLVGNSKTLGKSSLEVTASAFVPEDCPITSEARARALDGTFQCLKCLQSTSSEDSFYDHVRTAHIWKDDENDEDDEDNELDSSGEETKLKAHNAFYWCPECNMEFVVKPSLEKHILFAHSYIQNINEYLDNIGYGRKKKPLLENQCEVCRLKCSSSLEYDSHIRSHGMAFLKLRRQRGTT